LTQQRISIASAEIELFEGGAGAPTLFLHCGHGFSKDSPFVSLLTDKVRLIAPSHPGFGRSSLPDWIDRIEDIPHIYLELLDHLGLPKVDVIGCSIGGWIAAEMATMAPERFRKIVLSGPVGVKVGPVDKLDIPDFWAMSEEKLAGLYYKHPEKAKLAAADLSDEELAVVVRNRESLSLLTWEPYMHNPKLKHRLQRVRSPSLFLRGDGDVIVSADFLAAYASLVPAATTDVIVGAAHVSHIDQPETFSSKVLGFLDA
jgi:pimeloyl-ACP methyl ester carboxylesterase